MIAALRIESDESNALFSEPQRIGDLLPLLLAERGIKLPEDRELDQCQIEATREVAD